MRLYMFVVTGVLKGYDQLLNVVLDDASEQLRGGLLSCLIFAVSSV